MSICWCFCHLLKEERKTCLLRFLMTGQIQYFMVACMKDIMLDTKDRDLKDLKMDFVQP